MSDYPYSFVQTSEATRTVLASSHGLFLRKAVRLKDEAVWFQYSEQRSGMDEKSLLRDHL